MYHDVVEDGLFDSSGFPGAHAALYKMERGPFEEHLAAIRKAIHGRAPAGIIDPAAPWPRQWPVFLTFDDGGSSAFSPIACLLEKHGWRGHFFMTTDQIDRPGFLTREQIRGLRMRGHLIGSHSCSHPTRMASCSWDQLLTEWTASRNILEEILSEPVTVASVPGGYYSRKVGEAAATAGLRALFTSEPTTAVERVNGCLVLGRYAVKKGMGPAVSAGLAAGRTFPRLKQEALWKTKKAAKFLGGGAYVRIQKLLLDR
jgi:peptidoglycan/xylan/chitin deacetylase (PgdA/CDA1 family)